MKNKTDAKYKESEEQLKKAYEELLMLQNVNNALSSSMELSEILQAIVDGLTEVFGYYSSGVYLLDEDGSHLISKIYSINSRASKTIEKLIGFSIKDYKIPLHPGSMLLEILRTKKPILVEDIEEAIKSHTDRNELKPLAKPIVKITGIKFGIGAPLIAGGRTVGLIGIASRQQLTSQDIERLKAFADQAAIAIERARLYEALRESYDDLELKVEERTKELKLVVGNLQNEVTERKQAEEEKEKLLHDIGERHEEKEVLLREIHHRVKNNLAIVASLLYLQSKEAKGKEAVELLGESRTRVVAMANVHEKLYQSEDLSNINFVEYLDGLVDTLFKTYNVSKRKITLKRDIQDIQISIDDAIPIGLTTSELISNAIKHAFPGDREGEIGVSLRKVNGKIELKISDNGIGMPEIAERKTLGVKLVDGFVKGLHGEIKIDSSKEGTTYVITFRGRRNVKS